MLLLIFFFYLRSMFRTKLYKSLIIAFAFLTSAEVLSQKSVDPFVKPDIKNYGLISQSWGIVEGLPSDRIVDIVKDKDGFIWFSTYNGLVRFDGLNFKVFNNLNVDIIKGEVISQLFADIDGNIWFKGGKGGFIIRSKNTFNYTSEKSSIFKNALKLEQDSSGAIWFKTISNNLYKYLLPEHPSGKGEFTLFDSSKGLLGEKITVLELDKKGNLWVGTYNNGIFVYSNGIFVQVIKKKLFPSQKIRSIFFDSKKKIWVGTSRGLIVFKNNRIFKMPLLKGISNYFINDIKEDKDGNIWIATFNNGLFIFTGNELLKFGSKNGLSSESITSIKMDDDKIWVGTLNGGLNLIRKGQLQAISTNQGLTSGYANSFYQEKDGSVLIGTNKGLFKLNNTSKTDKVEKLKILRDKHIYAIGRDKKENLIVGTRQYGLYIFKNGEVKNYTSEIGLGSNFVRAIYVNDDNSILVGTNRGGIAIIENNKIRELHTFGGVSNERISFIHKSKNGKYWIGTSGGGVYIIDEAGNLKIINKKNGLLGNIISSIFEEDNGAIWLSSKNGGIARIADEKIKTFTMDDGLYSNSILNVIFDGEENLWFTTQKGIFSVKKKELENYSAENNSKISYQMFGKGDGMISEWCIGASPQSAIITEEGLIFVATVQGAVVIDPNSVKKVLEKTKLLIDEVFVNYKLLNLSDLLFIEPGPERIEFSFTAINFRNPSDIKYKYRLAGLEPNWIDAVSDRSISYTRLPYGSYTFMVQANVSGNYSDPLIAEVEIKILPYFWQLLPFQIFAGVILLGIIVSLTRFFYITKHNRHLKTIELERALENERIRISKDMHDEVGANLTKMSLLSEIAKNNINDKDALKSYLNKITDTGVEVAASLDELVWTVNPKNDKLDKMIYYIIRNAETYLAITEIKFGFLIPEFIPDKYVSSEARHNLFSVIKEGINNSVKHSECSKIMLNFTIAGNVLKISLSDNGIGINFKKIDPFCNGLSNMKNRMESVNGKFEIIENTPSGVIINLELII
ncbi:MAG: histidine kinase [Melioribacteraceae bacterium]|nr:histidine kinase [Melioribacteraceae bacterium]